MRKVVIIGGGFTGTKCAKALEKDFSVILIDHKTYFEFTPSILRTIIEPEHIKKIQALHKNYLRKAQIINGEVIEVERNYIKLKGKKKKVKYDYLIITSGSSYSSPIKEEGLIPTYRAKELISFHEVLKEAKKVLIIGGGLVGVELTAEICTHYNNKDITLVHSHPTLIERNNKKSQIYAEKFLKKHKVKILFGERITGKEGKYFLTEKGKKIKTDISFMCVGTKPNFEFMEENFKNILSDKNQVIINEFCQVKGCRNIFAGGDITSIKEEKTAQAAERYADIIIKNIRNSELKKSLAIYHPKKGPMVISLGKYNGLFEYKNIVITGLIPAILKKLIELKSMWHYK